MTPRIRRSPPHHEMALALIGVASLVPLSVTRADANLAGGPNLPPNCSGAAADATTLWPPNHTFRAIAITGVTDPDGDPVTIRVVGITQDEPTIGTGGGDACPGW